jgi:putative tricarboxylic transport membrane protein
VNSASSPKREAISLGIGVLGLAAVIAWQTSRIPSEAAYAQVGPAIIPWLVSVALAVLGLAILAAGLTGRWHSEPAPCALDRTSLAWLVGGLLLNLVLIDLVGFILASTLLFVCAARAFGSRRVLRDAAIGFVIALLCYVGFDRVLGYEIGSGVIESLI